MRDFKIGNYKATIGYVEDNYWNGSRLGKPVQFVYWRISNLKGEKFASGRTLSAGMAIEIATFTIGRLNEMDKRRDSESRVSVEESQLILL